MRKVYNLITTILLVILLALAAALILPKVFGITPMAVLSGSMEPTYHVGSLIYVQKTDAQKIEAGDPITFKIGEDTVVTHRVVEVDKENQAFTTKGDANETNDGGTVAFQDLIGKPLFSIPLLGYLAVYIGTKAGTILLITFILVVLILTFLPDLIAGPDKKEEEKKQKD